MEMPFALIARINGAESGIPGDFTTKSAVSIFSSECFVFRDFLVVSKSAVDNHFGNAGIGCRVFDAFKFIVEGFFSIWHRLPLGVSPYFSHFVAGNSFAQHFAAIG